LTDRRNPQSAETRSDTPKITHFKSFSFKNKIEG
jgi:hypothetical protein